MKKFPMRQRETEFKRRDSFRDETGQAHFPPTKLGPSEIDAVRLGRSGGYYPKMGEGKNQ